MVLACCAFECGRIRYDDERFDRSTSASRARKPRYTSSSCRAASSSTTAAGSSGTVAFLRIGQEAIDFADRSKRYLAYKVNADFLLLNLGLFHPDSNLLGHAYFDKGETYYYSAAAHLKAIKGGRSGLSDVMEKLSGRFGKYVEILRAMKNRADNYFSFHVRIPEAELKRFEKELAEEAAKRRPPPSS